ncbi:MAG TPA: hypothetical protein DEQ80_00730 [Anaerolinea thermolimosa]|uniref:Polymerase/histidinol phosphatase N-terminal domain-containing protein n=1 Tax=Anaerolinea thermolimosa TaxID=229919 RepID=A0A3D1JCQ3_9CHLR|nr:CehA/McbA family metallohydrolase [Anaerolinea thermolimosa]GAP05693.1 predicted metal-dependent phosphoesterase [Anaerolinea thermolimosa]HCE16359.1 hypothetical protein [Anaerolinea thermolimosa]
MPEIKLNLHMHTPYSDGSGSHAFIAHQALQAELDAIIVTDHNVLVRGLEGYYREGQRSLLLLIGEEVHDQARDPQKNHLLVFGVEQEVAPLAADPQGLINRIRQSGGLSFIAHPIDPALPAFHEDDISWVTWDVQGFTGLELWNGFSELKTVIRSRLDGLFYAYFPQFIPRGPLPGTLRIWDELLTTRPQPCVAVGGSDAHALNMRLGPLRRQVLPYSFHFKAINNHLLLDEPLSGDFIRDKQAIYNALRKGHLFIGYDLPAPTDGFRFTASGRHGTASMGDEIPLGDGITFQIRLPMETECRLIRNGVVLKTWHRRQICTFITNQPGIYRVECTLSYLGRRRGWIYSNPIYVRG